MYMCTIRLQSSNIMQIVIIEFFFYLFLILRVFLLYLLILHDFYHNLGEKVTLF